MAKQLGEFLQEKQEPFALNVYLIERGYLKHKFYSKNSTCKTSNISTSIPLHYKKITLIPKCPKIVRIVVTKISSFSKENKPKKSVGGNHNVSEDDKFSSGSSTTMLNSCSYSQAEEFATSTPIKAEEFRVGDHLSMKEIDEEKNLGRRSAEDNNQHSPVSVLEEIEFDDDDGEAQNHEKRTQESSSKLENLFEHYTKNKNAVLRSKQLLFDCVREVLENQRPKKERGCQLQLQKFLGAQELWKLIYENIWSWSKEVIVDEINVEQVVHADLLTNSLIKWNNFEEQRRQIGTDIEAAIFEDISNEIIKELIK